MKLLILPVIASFFACKPQVSTNYEVKSPPPKDSSEFVEFPSEAQYRATISEWRKAEQSSSDEDLRISSLEEKAVDFADIYPEVVDIDTPAGRKWLSTKTQVFVNEILPVLLTHICQNIGTAVPVGFDKNPVIDSTFAKQIAGDERARIYFRYLSQHVLHYWSHKNTHMLRVFPKTASTPQSQDTCAAGYKPRVFKQMSIAERFSRAAERSVTATHSQKFSEIIRRAKSQKK